MAAGWAEFLSGPSFPGETAAVDSEAVYKHLFTRIPAQLFHSPMMAFEFIQFCRDNIQFFRENISIFRRSFPNLFKVWGLGLVQALLFTHFMCPWNESP